MKFTKFIYALAPMAGVTDFAFRKICADFGADMVVTEMISAKALANNNKKTAKLLREESTAIKCCQLFGHDVDSFAKIFDSNIFDAFDVIDFNCGCPAQKIVRNNDGSAMMRDIENSRKVILKLVECAKKPVSVKFRLGIGGEQNYIEFAKMCEDCGVSFITLHARTREQGYSGVVDKQAYKKLINSVKIPVLWSGDISSKEDVEYAKEIGCAGVMIGRHAMGNPEIFSKLKVMTPPYSKKQAVLKHLDMLKSYFPNEHTLVSYFKKHLLWYVKNFNQASLIKLKILEFSTLRQIEDAIEDIF